MCGCSVTRWVSEVTPLENLCGCWVSESDSTKILCGCSVIRWDGESDSTLKYFVGALSPDKLVRVTPLKNLVDSLSPDG